MPWNCHLNFSWIGNEDPCLSNGTSLYCNRFCRQGQYAVQPANQEWSWRVHKGWSKEIKVTDLCQDPCSGPWWLWAGTSGNNVRCSWWELVGSVWGCRDLFSFSVTQQKDKDLKWPVEKSKLFICTCICTIFELLGSFLLGSVFPPKRWGYQPYLHGGLERMLQPPSS